MKFKIEEKQIAGQTKYCIYTKQSFFGWGMCCYFDTLDKSNKFIELCIKHKKILNTKEAKELMG